MQREEQTGTCTDAEPCSRKHGKHARAHTRDFALRVQLHEMLKLEGKEQHYTRFTLVQPLSYNTRLLHMRLAHDVH